MSRHPAGLVARLSLLFGALFLSVESAPTSGVADVPSYDARQAVVLVASVFDPERITISGTGFVVHPLGVVLTNGHLASGRALVNNRIIEASNVSFRVWLGAGTPAERELPAFRIALTQKGNHDLALLQLPAEHAPYPYLKLGRAADAEAGAVVRALGFPLGSQFYAVSGSRPPLRSVSGLVRKIGKGSDGTAVWIEHTAPIIQGYSGGPLLNESGAVVGINTWAVKESPERLAIPAELAAVWIAEQGFSLSPASPKGIRPLADRLDWINLSPVTEAPQKVWCVTTQNFLLPAIHKNSEVTMLASRNYLARTPPQIVHLSDGGETRWTRTLTDDPSTPPVVVPGVGFAFVLQNSLFLYSDAGEMVWERTLAVPEKKGSSREVPRVFRWLPPVYLAEGLMVVAGDSPEVVAFNAAGERVWRAPAGPAAAMLPVAGGVAVFPKPAGFIGSPGEVVFLKSDGAESGRLHATTLSDVPAAQFVLPAASEPGGDLYARVARSVLARSTADAVSRWSRSDFEMWQGGELGSADAPTRIALLSARGESLSVLNKLNGATLARIPSGASAAWVTAGWIGDDTLVAVRTMAADQGAVSALTVLREENGAWQPVAQWRAGPGPGVAIPGFLAVKTGLGDRIYAVLREAGESRVCALIPPSP
jgi:hypothetical protein